MLPISEVWRYMTGTAQIHSGQRLQSALSSSKPWFPSKGNFLCKSQRPAENPLDAWAYCKAHFSSYTICTAFPMTVRVSPWHMGQADTGFGNKMLLRRLDLGFRYAFGVCYPVLNLFIKKYWFMKETHSIIPQKKPVSLILQRPPSTT